MNYEDRRTRSRKIRQAPLHPDVLAGMKKLGRKGESVFHTADGERSTNNVQRDFRAITGNAEVSDCTLHDLRRTVASKMAMAG